MTVKLQCRHCPTSTTSTEEVARHVGWRIWRGTTVSGKQAEDVVCAACAGNAPRPAEVEGWRVRCLTCDWVYDEWDDDERLTAKDAKYQARNHECEPRVEIAPPDGNEWFDEFDINEDGTRRKPETVLAG